MKLAKQRVNGSTRRFLMVTAIGACVVAGFHAQASASVTYELDRFDDVASASGCTGAANDCSLRGAISAANNDGQATVIVIPDGLYLLTIAGAGEDANATGDLDILADLEIMAAPGASPVIQQTAGDRIFDAQPNMGSLTISGSMALTGGYVHVYGSPGGLIRAAGSGSLTLDNVVLTDGEAYGNGGCISFEALATADSLSLTDVTISGCQAGEDGGGLFAKIDDSHASFDGLVIKNCVADQTGGGLYILDSSTTVHLLDSTIQDNVSPGSGSGGGIMLFNSSALIERSTVAKNRVGAVTRGGAVTRNIANGGGLAVWDSDLILRNSTVSGNVVEGDSCVGSAIMVYSGGSGASVLVQQSTIVGDPTSSLLWPAVGITVDGTVTFEASIIEGGCNIVSTGTFASNGFNVERPIDGAITTQCGLDNPSDLLTSSPFLRPLGYYGGDTHTHALLPSAPAMWLVPSTYCQVTDQRLAPRGLLYCDAGSFESSGVSPDGWIFSDDFESGDTSAW